MIFENIKKKLQIYDEIRGVAEKAGLQVMRVQKDGEYLSRLFL